MPIRNFFAFGNRATPQMPSDMSQREKELLIKTSNTIFNALDPGKNETREEAIAKSPVTDLRDAGMAAGDYSLYVNVFSKYIYAVERDKRTRLLIYREMSKYPEIAFAVDEYVDEAINENADGNFAELRIRNDAIRENDNQRKTLIAEFNHLMYDVINADKHVAQWFREFMIDGEIFFEKIADINDETKGIVKVKRLMSTRTYPIWKDIESDEILFFSYQSDDSQLLSLPREKIAYANSGKYDWSKEEDMKLCLSFLEEAKTTYKRLKLLEDALVIYRIVRAPERRVFKIDVGNLPKGRADQFMQEMIKKYRQRKFFDPASGDVSEGLDMMAMTEDFWFPVFQGGRSSEVTTLPGGQGLGEIADVEYFRNKMYQGLKIPKSRFGEDNKFSIGDTQDITREEVKFVKEVKRYTERFSEVFKNLFLTHLRFKGIADEYGITEQDIKIHMFANNLFEKFLEAKVLELRFQNFSNFKDLIDTEKPLFSRKWVTEKFLEITEEEWKKNQELLAAENMNGAEEEGDGSGGGGGGGMGDLGGGGGGGDMGGGDLGGDEAGGDAAGDETGDAAGDAGGDAGKDDAAL
jgi:uncharacterized membrane protein YgcG